MPAVDIIIEHIGEYLEAIQIIHDKQLNVLSENIRQQSELDEIGVWNNALTLSYMKHRYTILKQALLLLSNSEQHRWLKFGTKSHKNTYEPILRDIISKFNHEDMAVSLEKGWEQMADAPFQQELSQIKRKIWIDKALFMLSLTIVFLALLAVSLTCLLIGMFTHSSVLALFGFLFPIGIGFLSILVCGAGALSGVKPLFPASLPIPFKDGIEKQFASLEKAFQTEKENTEFTIDNPSFSSSLSVAKESVSKSTLTVEPPTNFKKQQPRIELYEKFNRSNFLFLSSKSPSSALSLKDTVDAEYTTALKNTSK